MKTNKEKIKKEIDDLVKKYNSARTKQTKKQYINEIYEKEKLLF